MEKKNPPFMMGFKNYFECEPSQYPFGLLVFPHPHIGLSELFIILDLSTILYDNKKKRIQKVLMCFIKKILWF